MTKNRERLICLWLEWRSYDAHRARHYFEFYNDVVTFDSELAQLSLSEVIDILAETEPLRPLTTPPRDTGTFNTQAQG